MAQKPSIFVRFFKIIFSIVNSFRRLVLNLLFFGFIAFILFSVGQDGATPKLENGSALVVNLDGIVVEELTEIDPFAALSGQDSDKPQEILLADIVHAIKEAASDDRIAGILMKPGAFSASPAKLEDIGRALTEFKQSEKPVLFYGGGIEQSNYYLASFADEIVINPEGGVLLEGYGMSRIFYREALDKLQITTHLYRVGKYKSFGESYTRNDMSEPAKEASQEVINDLWGSFVDTVSANRDIDPRALQPSFDNLTAMLDENENDIGKMAVAAGLVDRLATDVEMRNELFERFGTSKEDDKALKAISLDAYSKLVAPVINPMTEDQIAIVVAQGTILNGNQPAGTIGGKSTSKLLRKARLDDDVKAVVLRVDSGGGSAYASEQIRQEILALKDAGKPVIASMGGVAASGGYWISASADKIYAQPDTITGSIGIIAMFQTFEKAADFLGIHSDGVATSEFRQISFIEPLNDKVGPIVQRMMDKGYHDFISLVSDSRGLSLEEVDAIAQGRIWSGADAKGLGLVDELGSLDAAIIAAADLAELEDYDTKVIGHELSPEQELLRELMNSVSVYLPEPSANSKLMWQLQGMLTPIAEQLRLNDPNNIYYLCQECSNVH